MQKRRKRPPLRSRERVHPPAVRPLHGARVGLDGWRRTRDHPSHRSLHRRILHRALLEDDLVPSYDRLRPGKERIVFQQDNAPIHTAHVVRDWMAGQPRLVVLEWTSRSPDLNPIGECNKRSIITCFVLLNYNLYLQDKSESHLCYVI